MQTITSNFVFAALCTALPAQITIQATAARAGVVEDQTLTLIAPGTDISTGFQLAETSFRTVTSALQVDAIVAVDTSATNNGGLCGPGNSIATDIDLVISSATAGVFTIDFGNDELVTTTAGCQFGSASVRYDVTITGWGTVSNIPFERRQQLDVAIEPSNPLRASLRVQADASVFSGSCTAVASCQCSISVRGRDRSAAYGIPCGLEVQASPLLLPNNRYRIDIVDSTPLPSGILLVGSAGLATPLPWGCTLYTDFFATAPLSMGSNGRTQIDLRIPPGIWTMQAGTFGGTTIHMSGGLGFVGR